MKQPIHIAIDGPAGSGKSTVARLVSEKLGYLYVYTGAMYRAAALLANRHGIDWSNESGISKLVERVDFQMRAPDRDEQDGRFVTLLLDGEDVSADIFNEHIGQGASIVAVHNKVRSALVLKQQEIARKQNVVMEGRDVTFRVLPEARLKVFLTADESVRAKRRYHQLVDRGEKVSYQSVLSDLRVRDKRDLERKIDPLQIISDAWVLDTSHLTIDEVVEKIIMRIKTVHH